MLCAIWWRLFCAQVKAVLLNPTFVYCLSAEYQPPGCIVDYSICCETRPLNGAPSVQCHTFPSMHQWFWKRARSCLESDTRTGSNNKFLTHRSFSFWCHIRFFECVDNYYINLHQWCRRLIVCKFILNGDLTSLQLWLRIHLDKVGVLLLGLDGNQLYAECE